MSTGELIRELFIELEKLSDAEIIVEYGIDYLEFKTDAAKRIKEIRLARIYIPLGRSVIGLN